MKQRYIFHHDHYYHTLKGQIGEGVPVFHGVRQRGGGLGSVLGGIAKYAIPLIQRYIMPHAKSATLSTFADIASGGEIKQALKRNGLKFLNDVGNKFIERGQIGKGNYRRVKPSKSNLTHPKIKSKSKTKRKQAKSRPRKKNVNRKPRRKPNRSRLDIFE